MVSSNRLKDRRAFLSFLAASPVLAYAGFSRLAGVEDVMAEPLPPQGTAALGAQNDAVIKFREGGAQRFRLRCRRATKLSTPTTHSSRRLFQQRNVRANREAHEVRDSHAPPDRANPQG